MLSILGLDYINHIQWAASYQDLTQDTFYNKNDDPSIREEVLDSRLGGSVPCVLRFFLQIFGDKSDKTSD
jgi:hypothetical protein